MAEDDYETITPTIGALIVREYNDVPSNFRSESTLGKVMSTYKIPDVYKRQLVCAIAARESASPIKTFAIGMSEDAIDLKYAKQVADYIGSDHTEIYMTPDDVLSSLETVIRILGTFDITTIRASMGMYLLCKAIHEQTDIRVLLTGEISDELFGYKYTDFAPSAEAFQAESQKRIRELHMYDVCLLYTSRCV